MIAVVLLDLSEGCPNAACREVLLFLYPLTSRCRDLKTTPAFRAEIILSSFSLACPPPSSYFGNIQQQYCCYRRPREVCHARQSPRGRRRGSCLLVFVPWSGAMRCGRSYMVYAVNTNPVSCVYLTHIVSYCTTPVRLTSSRPVCFFLLFSSCFSVWPFPLPCCCRRAVVPVAISSSYCIVMCYAPWRPRSTTVSTTTTVTNSRWPGSHPASGLCTWTIHLTPGVRGKTLLRY